MPEVAILVDTNMFGDGYKTWNIDRLLREADGTYEVVVSEVTIWEIAEHVLGLTKAARQNIGKIETLLPEVAAAFAKLGEVDEEDVVTRLTDDLRRRGVTIYELDPHASIAGVRGEVFVRDGGSRKQGVKTGAADAAIVALAEDLDGEFDVVIVLTRDRGLEKVVRALGIETRRDPSHALEAAGRYHPVSAEQQRLVEAAVKADASRGAEGILWNALAAEVHEPPQFGGVDSDGNQPAHERDLWGWAVSDDGDGVDVDDVYLDAELTLVAEVGVYVTVNDQVWLAGPDGVIQGESSDDLVAAEASIEIKYEDGFDKPPTHFCVNDVRLGA